MGAGAIAGIVLAAVIALATVGAAAYFLYYRRKLTKKVEKGELDLEELQAEEHGWK